MNAAKRAIEFLHHGVKRRFKRCAPPNQNVVVPSAKRRGGRQPDEFAQTAAHAIAFHRISDLAGDREADPWWPSLRTGANLHDKCVSMCSRALPGSLGHGPKVTPAFQPLHMIDFGSLIWLDRIAVTDSQRSCNLILGNGCNRSVT
jgi:hypothetical protein